MGCVMGYEMLENETDFHLRRAVERLREGLFDPVAVRLLTAHEDRLNQSVGRGFRTIDRGTHLCICGAYGQGKSHSLNYIHDRALKENFAVSMINLDPREIPFQDFRQVYRALVTNLRFPDSDTSLAMRWRTCVADKSEADVLTLLPDTMPHPFRATLMGMAQKNLPLTDRQRQSKQHRAYRPREFPYVLARALAGEAIPTYRLQQTLKYRQVAFYREESLVCRGNEPYLMMVRSLPRLFQGMGYRGWVILFDEGESIAQVRITTRSRCYQLLDRMFFPEVPAPGLFPVFAFTDDFFQKVEAEPYDQVRVRNDEEMPYFDKNYATSWRDVARHDLQSLSQSEWDALSEKLMHLHARAYLWHPSEAQVRRALTERLSSIQGQETRYKLKALVDELDLIHQAQTL